MALYLNTNAAYKDFQMLSNDRYFVDKSAIIEKINERVKTKNRFLCSDVCALEDDDFGYMAELRK